MRALCIQRRPSLGGLREELEMLDLPVPDPGKKEIRVKVHASTISVDDQHMAEGSMFGGFPVAPNPYLEAIVGSWHRSRRYH